MNDLAPPGPPAIPELDIAWNEAGDSLVLTFSTEFGRYYLVQISDDLGPESWQDHSPLLPGSGGVIEFDLASPLPATSQFFRIVIPETP